MTPLNAAFCSDSSELLKGQYEGFIQKLWKKNLIKNVKFGLFENWHKKRNKASYCPFKTFPSSAEKDLQICIFDMWLN